MSNMMDDLNDNDILNFLMNSDFSDNFSPEEFRFLLLKFRTFYRIKSSVYMRDVGDLKLIIENLNKDLKSFQNKLSEKTTQLNDIQNKLDSISGRRELTTMERIRGFIDIK
jgi:hypothetical protein